MGYGDDMDDYRDKNSRKAFNRHRGPGEMGDYTPEPEREAPEQKTFYERQTVYFNDDGGFVAGRYQSRCMTETSWVEHDGPQGETVTREIPTNDLLSQREYEAAINSIEGPYTGFMGSIGLDEPD